jgi:hypothetical protein
MQPVPMTDYGWEAVTDAFRGTIASKVLDASIPSDTMWACYLPGQELSVHYVDTGEVLDSLYADNYLDKKDKYSFYLNNIHPLVEVTNESAETEDELVLIKDSYANSMVPFLVSHYRKIYVFDTRYYKEAVSDWVNDHEKVKHVLIVYNLGTMDQDLGIGGIY